MYRDFKKKEQDLPLVKICGITNIEDAITACNYGADFLGFIFVTKSPRYITAETGKAIISGFRDENKGFKGITGLFVDETIENIIDRVLFCGLDLVQLHGSESPEFCVLLKQQLRKKHGKKIKILKTFKIAGEILPVESYITDDYTGADYILFDTFCRVKSGGTGQVFDWKALSEKVKKIKKPFFVAGGLKIDNVAEAVRTLEPFGVDISSGVEISPGIKDPRLLKEFIKNAKKQ
jgi:phosphoribosylanthranilate isomerase